MNTRLPRVAAVASALFLTLSLGCTTINKIAHNAAGSGKASAKSEKDIAACEKMCAVAGDAEDNKAAVDKCQKKCRQ